jgi:hypothetical protein
MVGSGYLPKGKSNIAFNATLYAGFRLNDQWFLQPKLNGMFNNGMEISGHGNTFMIEYPTLAIPLLVRRYVCRRWQRRPVVLDSKIGAT